MLSLSLWSYDHETLESCYFPKNQRCQIHLKSLKDIWSPDLGISKFDTSGQNSLESLKSEKVSWGWEMISDNDIRRSAEQTDRVLIIFGSQNITLLSTIHISFKDTDQSPNLELPTADSIHFWLLGISGISRRFRFREKFILDLGDFWGIDFKHLVILTFCVWLEAFDQHWANFWRTKSRPEIWTKPDWSINFYFDDLSGISELWIFFFPMFYYSGTELFCCLPPLRKRAPIFCLFPSWGGS